MDSSSKTTLDSTKTNPEASFSTDLQEDLFEDLFLDIFSPTIMTMEEPNMEGVQNVGHESEITLSPLNPPATVNENEMYVDYVPSPIHSLDMTDYDDLLAKLCNDDTDDFQLGENIFQDYPSQNDPIPLDDEISLEGLSVLGEISSPSAVRASIGYNASVGGIAFSNVNAVAATDSNVVAAGKQVVGPSTVGGGGVGSSNSSQQQFQVTGINSVGLPATMPQYNSSISNQRFFWLRPPPLSDLPNFVPAWEGSLVGRIHQYRQFLIQARAMRKPTSFVALNVQWCCRLEISVFLPTTSVNYTMRFCGGPIDYLFFNIIQFNNLDLYDHLSNNNMCAKIVLPSHVIILSTTNSKYHFLGTIFPRETVFVEPSS